MRATIKPIIAAAVAILMSLTLSAQPNGKKMSREDFAAKQAAHISEELAFDEATSAKFQETYCAFQQELWALGPGLDKPKPGEQGEEEIGERFERSQKILDLRKKYCDIYSTFLTQKQISRVYEIEQEMMHKMHKQRPQKSRRPRPVENAGK